MFEKAFEKEEISQYQALNLSPVNIMQYVDPEILLGDMMKVLLTSNSNELAYKQWFISVSKRSFIDNVVIYYLRFNPQFWSGIIVGSSLTVLETTLEDNEINYNINLRLISDGPYPNQFDPAKLTNRNPINGYDMNPIFPLGQQSPFAATLPQVTGELKITRL